MEDVVARLEAVAARLELVEGSLVAAPGAKTAVAPPLAAKPAAAAAAAANGAAPADASSGDFVADYQALLAGGLAAALDASAVVGGEVLRATRVLAEGFRREAAVLAAMQACCRPEEPADLQALVAPVAEQLAAAADLTAGPRSPYASHFRVVAEASQALSWVVFSGPGCGMQLPAAHVEDCWTAAEFYSNKVVSEWRGKGEGHAAWVAALKALLAQLKAYCARHFPAGPVWNAAGCPVSAFKPGGAGAAAAAAAPAAAAPPAKRPAGGPPPPPPPPPPGGPGSLLDRSSAPSAAARPATGPSAAAAGPNMSALFSQLNKGEGVTTGLRKVTDDMKTKNRADRTAAVPAGASKPGAAEAAPVSAAAAAAPPPRFECEQDRKWVVENQVGNREIVIADTCARQTVYIYNCKGCTIQVRGKVAAITLDRCARTALVFEHVVASCEVVNCAAVEVQCTGSAPTLAVDKSDGCQLYLPRSALEGGTDVTTAKSSEVNVIVPGAAEEDDPQESAVPEQFVSRFRGGRLVTEPVSHSAA